MTMHTVFFKEHEGIAQNSINGALSAVPRWSGLGSQLPPVAYSEAFVQSKLASLELSAGGNGQFNAAKETEDQQGLGKGNTTHFTLFSGCRTAENGEKTPLQTVSSFQAATMDYRGHFELGFGQPLICAKYPYAEQCYGMYSTYGTQISGRIMLPLSMTTDGGPIFVNAKQYSGIMRRRKKRAEAEVENKVLKIRKPYLHLSRHLHAMRRARGNGGRFLNTKNSNGSTEKTSPKMAAEKNSSHSPLEPRYLKCCNLMEGLIQRERMTAVPPVQVQRSPVITCFPGFIPFKLITSTLLFSPFQMWQIQGLAFPWLLVITSKSDDDRWMDEDGILLMDHSHLVICSLGQLILGYLQFGEKN
ncbi:hypothetical protein Pfo_028575 [Paulownia fortunei]|nr:hypothetical protein Pfo_028575 [Paulownia fortunei]